MKLDPAVRKESVFAFVAALAGAVLVQVIFLVIGLWDLSVLWGGLIGFAISSLNFFLMGLTMQRALETGDQSRATGMIRLSYLWRTLFQLAAVAASLIFDGIHWVPVVASLFFIRIAIFLRQFFAKKEEEPVPSSPSVPPAEDEDEEDAPDEFEKFVEHWGRRVKVDYSQAKPAEKPRETSETTDSSNTTDTSENSDPANTGGSAGKGA